MQRYPEERRPHGPLRRLAAAEALASRRDGDRAGGEVSPWSTGSGVPAAQEGSHRSHGQVAGPRDSGAGEAPGGERGDRTGCRSRRGRRLRSRAAPASARGAAVADRRPAPRASRGRPRLARLRLPRRDGVPERYRGHERGRVHRRQRPQRLLRRCPVRGRALLRRRGLRRCPHLGGTGELGAGDADCSPGRRRRGLHGQRGSRRRNRVVLRPGGAMRGRALLKRRQQRRDLLGGGPVGPSRSVRGLRVGQGCLLAVRPVVVTRLSSRQAWRRPPRGSLVAARAP